MQVQHVRAHLFDEFAQRTHAKHGKQRFAMHRQRVMLGTQRGEFLHHAPAAGNNHGAVPAVNERGTEAHDIALYPAAVERGQQVHDGERMGRRGRFHAQTTSSDGSSPAPRAAALRARRA